MIRRVAGKFDELQNRAAQLVRTIAETRGTTTRTP